MQTADVPRTGYYFALPRLLMRLSGGAADRSEQNGTEAAVAGTLVHAITFLFAAHVLLADRTPLQQLLLLVPLLVVVLIWWSALMYANALLIKAIRATRFFANAADRHLQSVLVGSVTTFFAWHLIAPGSWMQALGILWMAAVALNLVAAAALALMHAEPAR